MACLTSKSTAPSPSSSEARPPISMSPKDAFAGDDGRQEEVSAKRKPLGQDLSELFQSELLKTFYRPSRGPRLYSFPFRSSSASPSDSEPVIEQKRKRKNSNNRCFATLRFTFPIPSSSSGVAGVTWEAGKEGQGIGPASAPEITISLEALCLEDDPEEVDEQVEEGEWTGEDEGLEDTPFESRTTSPPRRPSRPARAASSTLEAAPSASRRHGSTSLSPSSSSILRSPSPSNHGRGKGRDHHYGRSHHLSTFWFDSNSESSEEDEVPGSGPDSEEEEDGRDSGNDDSDQPDCYDPHFQPIARAIPVRPNAGRRISVARREALSDFPSPSSSTFSSLYEDQDDRGEWADEEDEEEEEDDDASVYRYSPEPTSYIDHSYRFPPSRSSQGIPPNNPNRPSLSLVIPSAACPEDTEAPYRTFAYHHEHRTSKRVTPSFVRSTVLGSSRRGRDRSGDEGERLEGSENLIERVTKVQLD